MKNNKSCDSRHMSAQLLENIAMGFSKAASKGICCFIYHQPAMPKELKALRNR